MARARLFAFADFVYGVRACGFVLEKFRTDALCLVFPLCFAYFAVVQRRKGQTQYEILLLRFLSLAFGYSRRCLSIVIYIIRQEKQIPTFSRGDFYYAFSSWSFVFSFILEGQVLHEQPSQSQPQPVFPFFLLRTVTAVTPTTAHTANTIMTISAGVIFSPFSSLVIQPKTR